MPFFSIRAIPKLSIMSRLCSSFINKAISKLSFRLKKAHYPKLPKGCLCTQIRSWTNWVRLSLWGYLRMRGCSRWAGFYLLWLILKKRTSILLFVKSILISSWFRRISSTYIWEQWITSSYMICWNWQRQWSRLISILLNWFECLRE